MAKLYFRYGAMGSSKTANLLMVRHNYVERGQRVALLKPAIENRDGEKTIASRVGISAECDYVEDFLNRDLDVTLAAILVDEAQFLSEKQVDSLAEIVDAYNIPVLCYGLRTDFLGKFFEGSRRLMEIADVIEEIPTICWCGRKAQFSARICNGRMVRSGKQVLLGGNDRYVALCRRHFLHGDIGANPVKR